MDIGLKKEDAEEYRSLGQMLVLHALEKRVQENQKQKNATTHLPASPFEVQQIVRVAASGFQKYLSIAKAGDELWKNEVAFINR